PPLLLSRRRRYRHHGNGMAGLRRDPLRPPSCSLDKPTTTADSANIFSLKLERPANSSCDETRRFAASKCLYLRQCTLLFEAKLALASGLFFLLVSASRYPERRRCGRKRRSPFQRRFTSPIREGIASDFIK